MNLSLLLPVTAAGTITALIAMLHRRLTPEIASFALGASLASISAAALPTLWIVSLGFIAHESTFGSGLRWCAELLGVHRPLSPVVGIPSRSAASASIAPCAWWRHGAPPAPTRRVQSCSCPTSERTHVPCRAAAVGSSSRRHSINSSTGRSERWSSHTNEHMLATDTTGIC